MRQVTVLTGLVLILIVRAAIAAEASGPSRGLQPQVPFPVPVVEMSGTAEAIGQSHARQLGEPIRNLFAAYFGKYFSSATQKNLSMMAASAFRPHVSAEHRAEIDALASGVGL